jgi:hypothetical protein
MKIFYGRNVTSIAFIPARDACRDAPVWIALYKAKTWREFISALPEEYKDFFDDRFEDDSDLDQTFDPELVMGSYEAYFPPGLPDGLVRHWMPKEIITRFGDRGYDGNISFDAEHAEEMIAILHREGFECVEAPDLVSMMSFAVTNRNELAGIERLLEATQGELARIRNHQKKYQ